MGKKVMCKVSIVFVMCIPQGAEPSLDFQQAVMACQKTALNPDDFCCIQLVYGNAGELYIFVVP